MGGMGFGFTRLDLSRSMSLVESHSGTSQLDGKIGGIARSRIRLSHQGFPPPLWLYGLVRLCLL